MAKKKKPNPEVSVKLLVNAAVSQIAEPVDKKKVKSRGPREKGQSRYKVETPILTTQEEWDKRWKLAVEILTTGKAAAEKQPTAKPEAEKAEKPKEPATEK
jgi:hypothetical protein